MKTIRKILCIADPTTEEQPARDRAAELARKYDAELVLYMSYFNRYVPAAAGGMNESIMRYKDELLTELRGDLEKMAEPLRESGLTVTTDAEWHSSLVDSVLEKAEAEKADLVVKDTHYHTTISRALFTNTDWSLIRKCPVPLWLVKPNRDLGLEPKLVACVDPLHEHEKPAEMDDRILAASAALAAKLDGQVHAFHAYNPLIRIGNAAKWAVKPERIPIEELSERIREAHEQAFSALCDRHEIPDKRRHLRTGPIEDVLPGTIIELGAAVAVMGSVSRKPVRRMLLGNTAEKVMDHVPCDLLVLKP